MTTSRQAHTKTLRNKHRSREDYAWKQAVFGTYTPSARTIETVRRAAKSDRDCVVPIGIEHNSDALAWMEVSGASFVTGSGADRVLPTILWGIAARYGADVNVAHFDAASPAGGAAAPSRLPCPTSSLDSDSPISTILDVAYANRDRPNVFVIEHADSLSPVGASQLEDSLQSIGTSPLPGKASLIVTAGHYFGGLGWQVNTHLDVRDSGGNISAYLRTCFAPAVLPLEVISVGHRPTTARDNDLGPAPALRSLLS